MKKKNDRTGDFGGIDNEIFHYPVYEGEMFFPYYTEQMRFDPNGSYTGVPEEIDEKPVQDVDDL